MGENWTDTTLFAKFSNDHDQQLGCPLFTHLPAELRNRIFALALLAYDDESRGPYSSDTYYTRPGYMYPKRIDTSLLATCRRIYLETHLVPVTVNEHVFWCFCGPWRAHSDPWLYFSRMTHDQRRSVTRVHLFTRMYWLQDAFPVVCKLQVMALQKRLKITIRHSDWCGWDKNERLRMERDWTSNLFMLKNLEELELELECLDRDNDQLDEIVEAMMTWQFHLQNGRVLSPARADITRSHWVNPSSFCGTTYYSSERKLWQKVDMDFISVLRELFQPDPGLTYYIVTLTWRAVPAQDVVATTVIDPESAISQRDFYIAIDTRFLPLL